MSAPDPTVYLWMRISKKVSAAWMKSVGRLHHLSGNFMLTDAGSSRKGAYCVGKGVP